MGDSFYSSPHGPSFVSLPSYISHLLILPPQCLCPLPRVIATALLQVLTSSHLTWTIATASKHALPSAYPAIHSRFPLPSPSSQMDAVSPSLSQRDEVQTPECATQGLLESSSWLSLLSHSLLCPTTSHILQPDKMTSYFPNTHAFSSVFDSSPVFPYMLHAFPSAPLGMSLYHVWESEASTFLSPPLSQRKQQ